MFKFRNASINYMGRLRDIFLDEDCNRCEGDIPEEQRVHIPKQKGIPKDFGDADMVENGGAHVEKMLEELLGD